MGLLSRAGSIQRRQEGGEWGAAVTEGRDPCPLAGALLLEFTQLPLQPIARLGGETSMQWVTITTYCLEDEAASGKAEAAVANREPVSQRRRRRGALPNANATSATRVPASSASAATRSFHSACAC